MRRFSSEGSLLDLDFLPWKRVELKDQGYVGDGECGTYTPHSEREEPDGRLTAPSANEDKEAGPKKAGKGQLSKEFSVSVENVSGLGKQERSGMYLSVAAISDGFRAYSDSQLAPGGGSSESVGTEEVASPSPSSNVPPFSSGSTSSRSAHRQHTRAKLASAKLHLKSLFGQSPHSSNSNLHSPEPKDIESSSREKKSRLPFLRQWSQIGHSNARLSREELQKWAESLNTLLASRVGVSVFGAFLRSEFSEENLQFYLACEQYRQSSNNFTLQRRARDIYATYIQPGAPREVNLDSKTRDLTTQLLQAPSHTSLSHAQRRIYALLDTDCYPRFLQSSLYLSLFKEAD
ncbi:regulator of G-protein signaling 1 [Megalops cyprinoides]|uniref:regulator of G-protein signaling 1 n=1 Tax=Megalops cyprinoides TaxID=118141 RepID=UPI0018649959|nr:regulator of G-protein signaling 1 [Megalops cyprinoides]XP_036371661.1 regulator of G-protein signaling 1 [Megalops cyprinoides]